MQKIIANALGLIGIRSGSGWQSMQTTHQDAPLLLRWPTIPDQESKQSAFPILAVVDHQLSKILPNGLPDPQYNQTLQGLDQEIINAFDGTSGFPVLIETFGGKRHYYFYISQSANPERTFAAIASRWPLETFTYCMRLDTEWQFLKQYFNNLTT